MRLPVSLNRPMAPRARLLAAALLMLAAPLATPARGTDLVGLRVSGPDAGALHLQCCRRST